LFPARISHQVSSWASDANHPGLVSVAPKFEAHACAAKIDGIHLGDQNRAVATDIGTHYK